MTITKRDGSKEMFDASKIEYSLKRAFQAENEVYDAKVFTKACEDILDYIKEYSDIDVETIQDIVVGALYQLGYNKIGTSYEKYRSHRAQVREWVKTKEEFIKKYEASSNTADATVDDNSNVASKNIGIMNNEIHKPDNIEINRQMVVNKLKELYPDFDAKQYVKDLNNHIIYKHDESSFAGAIAPYCCSISMYPFLMNGIKELGGLSASPKNLDSFCGMYINLIFAVASQFAGAVATSEFLLYFDYFARKEWGDNYWEKYELPVTSDFCNKQKTIKNQIHQYFQQVVYSINQPSAARGMQAAFVNFSYFDKPFFEGMFGDFRFPDGSAPIWESLCWLQKEFMQWFNAERLKCIITFPVESFALVYKDGHFLDQETDDFVAEEYARGHSFFTYISDTVDSLSSCCFKGDEFINITNINGIQETITIKDFVENYTKDNNKYGLEINDNTKILSFNEKTDSELANITGVLKKEYTGNLYTFNINDHSICVTAEHPLLVKDIKTGEIMSLTADEVSKNINKYLIAYQET